MNTVESKWQEVSVEQLVGIYSLLKPSAVGSSGDREAQEAGCKNRGEVRESRFVGEVL